MFIIHSYLSLIFYACVFTLHACWLIAIFISIIHIYLLIYFIQIQRQLLYKIIIQRQLLYKIIVLEILLIFEAVYGEIFHRKWKYLDLNWNLTSISDSWQLIAQQYSLVIHFQLFIETFYWDYLMNELESLHNIKILFSIFFPIIKIQN